MNAIEWLEDTAPGFRDLPQADREAIFHFTLLWSFFEAKALRNRASVFSIRARVRDRATRGHLKVDEFESSFQYFQRRYLSDGELTPYFSGLRFQSEDDRDFVKKVLMSEIAEPEDRVIALLIIIYRLRNNLFHGEKWAYDIRGQYSNFENANIALIVAIRQLRL